MYIFRRILLISVTLISVVASNWLLPAPASADTSTDAAKQQACIGSGGTWTNPGTGAVCVSSGPSLDNTIASAVNILSIIVGIVAVIMMMVGGFRYITSGGDANAVSKAKQTITYAIIGLVLVFFAQILVKYVVTTSTATPPPVKAKARS